MPSGYSLPASTAGYLRSVMYGICVAVKATTSYSSLSRKNVLKLWKSRPAAPMINTLVRWGIAPSFLGFGFARHAWAQAGGVKSFADV